MIAELVMRGRESDRIRDGKLSNLRLMKLMESDSDIVEQE